MSSEQALWDKLLREGKIKATLESIFTKAIANLITSNVEVIDGFQILEAGCGTAKYSLLYMRRDVYFVGLDFSSAALEVAKKLFRGKNADFIKGDVRFLPFREGSFDVVWNEGVVEHLQGDQRQRVISEMASVAKNGGQVAIIVPNAWCLSYRFLRTLLARKNEPWAFGLEIPYSPKELETRMIRAGLTIKKRGGALVFDSVRYISIIMERSIVSLLHRILGARWIMLNFGNDALNANFGWNIFRLGVRVSKHSSSILTDKRALMEFYDRIFERGEWGAGEWSDKFLPFITRPRFNLLHAFLYEILPGLVLDHGCGTGLHSVHLARKGTKVVGIDLSRRAIKCAKNRANILKINDKISFVIGDVENLPFRNSIFNGIYSHDVLAHVPNDEKALKEAARVLEAHGILAFVATCTGRYTIENHEEILAFDKEAKHIHRYSLQRLRQLLEESGFRIQQHIYYGHLFRYLTWKFHSLIIRYVHYRRHLMISIPIEVRPTKTTFIQKFYHNVLSHFSSLDFLLFGRIPSTDVFIKATKMA